jgi:hypothetical protein
MMHQCSLDSKRIHEVRDIWLFTREIGIVKKIAIEPGSSLKVFIGEKYIV